jgi:hypothetical protein
VANLEAFPKVVLRAGAADWLLAVKVTDQDTAESHTITGTFTAGVTHDQDLSLYKLVVEVTTTHTTETIEQKAQDVFDALTVDDIEQKPGVQTVFGNWQERAEAVISGLAAGARNGALWTGFGNPDRSKTRNDARSALTARGWTFVALHEHQDEDTVSIDEVG